MTTDLNAQSVGNYSTVQQRRHEDGAMSGGWWTRPGGGQRTVCQLCPRECNLKPGDRGFCFVRENRDGQIVLSTYGKSTGFCIDPIEKKPLNHFYPGTAVLSFGTAGCNLGCKFCQNWDISKSREVERLSEHAEPETIARAAQQLGCHSVAFTYNDPIVWAEYAIDTARACRQVGIKTVAVTAGYISAEARSEFFGAMDAANVDLKAFTEEFYQKITYSHLQPVLDTLVYLKHETDVWFEITNLVIPGANDSCDELQRMCDYLLQHLGDDTPIHFSAFHPDFRMRETPHTPPEKLAEAYDIARRQGLKYVYVGNVHDLGRQSTYCPNCGQLLIERDWYQLGKYALKGNRCRACDTQIPGRFSTGPGSWGPKRQPVRIAQFAHVEPSSKSVEHRAPAKKEVAMNSSQPSVAGTRSGTARSQVMAKLTAQQRDTLHKAACHWVTQTVLRQPRSAPEQVLDKLAEFTVHGIFVTLKRQDYLRGCCGVLGKPMLLGAATDQAAARTALEDQRMASISPSELPFLHCDVTVLGPLEPIQASAHARAEAVEIGKHGVVIHLGQSSGLLLPSVATERGWNAEQFLEAVCQKASLPPQAWTNPSATVFTFEGQSVSGPFHVDAAHSSALQVPPALTAEQLASYVALAGNNVAALVQGATPSYYAPELPDLNVNALVLSVQWGEPGQTKQGNAMHVSIRPGVPLQSTLFQMCQTVSQLLIRQRYNGAFQVGLSIGIDPAFHGSGEEVFIEGVDTQSRGFVINGPGHCVVGFDPQKPFDQLLESLRSHLPVGGRHGMVHSLEFLSSMRDVIAITSPVAVRASGSREPAVAGKFYPAEDAARREQVAGFFKGPNPKKTKALAIMVPHAGLRYSGQVAADVWRSVELPRSLIIISPKHTPAGINWAVCPFDRWRLSGSVSFSGDPGLAQQIVSQVPGMLFDAAAHEKEHGIEVQLPILEQVAPAAQIVGIAMAGGTWPEIDAAAEGLAAVVRASDQPPLLVISSDMNHYASDAENRRLDRLALDALATGDPQLLLATCRQHQISMCGVIPAALVMATLHKLGQPFKIKEIAYATSGDSSGEKSRVVGYAGTVFLPE